MSKESTPTSWLRGIGKFLIAIFVLLFLTGLFLGPTTPRTRTGSERNASMQTARIIAQCLSDYAQNHNGKYPDGKTSTEIFQQLLDQSYVTDPSTFYVDILQIPGKVRAEGTAESTHLKPENVCWDVTAGVDVSSSDKLPVVFLTGYKVTYLPGAAAVPLHALPSRTGLEWWNGSPSNLHRGIAVSNKDTSANWLRADDDGSISNFIPADFDPKGKTYRQLTP